MEIRSLQPFGVEVVGCDLNDATDDDVRRIYDAMESDNGCGVVCLRDQDLTPEALERGLGRFAKHFGALIRYDRWPGQSRSVRGCQHLALLGNYRARRDGEIVEGCKEGEQIGEFKPAFNVVEEWHTDGSFLAAPKSAIALCRLRRRTSSAANRHDAPQVRAGLARRRAAARRRGDAVRVVRARLRRLGGPRTRRARIARVRPFLGELHAPPRAPGPQAPENHARRRGEKTGRLLAARATPPRHGSPISLPEPEEHAARVQTAAQWVARQVRQDGRRGRRDGPPPRGARHRDGRLRARLEEGRRRPLGQPPATHAASPFDADKYQRLLFRAEFAGEAVLHGA